MLIPLSVTQNKARFYAAENVCAFTYLQKPSKTYVIQENRISSFTFSNPNSFSFLFRFNKLKKTEREKRIFRENGCRAVPCRGTAIRNLVPCRAAVPDFWRCRAVPVPLENFWRFPPLRLTNLAKNWKFAFMFTLAKARSYLIDAHFVLF